MPRTAVLTLLFLAPLLAGCASTAPSENDLSGDVVVSTAYDPERTEEGQRQFGLEPGEPARHGTLVVSLGRDEEAEVGHGTTGGLFGARTQADHEVVSGSTLRLEQGEDGRTYRIPLDASGRASFTVEEPDDKVVVLRVVGQVGDEVDGCRRTYSDNGPLQRHDASANTLVVGFGVTCAFDESG